YLEAGNRAFELGRYEDAEKLYQKALIEARREFAKGPLRDPDHGADYSDELYAYAKQDSTIINLSEHPSFGEIYTKLGDLYWVQGMYRKAEEAFKLALSVFETCFGKNAIQLAPVLDKLGKVFRAEGKFSDVDQYFRRALSIWETKDDGKSIEVSET